MSGDLETPEEQAQAAARQQQELADSDQRSAEIDQKTANADQAQADLEQAASDRDQATAERQHAEAPASEWADRAFRASSSERAEGKQERKARTAVRARTTFERLVASAQRDETTRARGRTASRPQDGCK